MEDILNKLHVGDSKKVLKKINNNSIDLIITSPPYWNAVEYEKNKDFTYEDYIKFLLEVWVECERVLKPNGKLAINTPILPIPQDIIQQDTRHIKNINNDIEKSILQNLDLRLFGLYIWQKQTSKLMFGSYPYPGNLLENNTIEFINVYVKKGKPEKRPQYIKDANKIKQKEWTDLIQQVWYMYPQDVKRMKNHPAPYPEKLPARLIKIFTYGAAKNFKGDIILDPFVGTGTTCVVAKKMKRQFIGIDNVSSYIQYAKGRLFKAKEGENINFLIGNAKNLSKDELDILKDEIDHSYNKKTDENEKEKLIDKNKKRTFGRNVNKQIQDEFNF
jgi:DNA modification methylase